MGSDDRLSVGSGRLELAVSPDLVRDAAISDVAAAQLDLERVLAAVDGGQPIDLSRYVDAMAGVSAAVGRWNDLFHREVS